MLKRYQVLIPGWLEEYIENLVQTYDLSFSEIIRLQICFSILYLIPTLYPEYKPGLSVQEIFKQRKEFGQNKLPEDEMHRTISKIYFEARKAIEYRLSKEKKLKKK